MKTLSQIMALLAPTSPYGMTRQPSERPMYPYPLWQKQPRSRFGSPSFTKKGPGRRHQSGKVKS